MTDEVLPVRLEVHIADEEPVRSFVAGVSEAAGMFAALGEDETAALPDAALLGIARLRGALAEIGREPAPLPPEPCRTCKGSGWVCESHRDKPWGGMCCGRPSPEWRPGEPCTVVLCGHGACHCGGAGEPCPAGDCTESGRNREPCSLDYPVTREQALGWARQAEWRLRSYYKYEFTFEAYCTVAYPDDPEMHVVEARAVVSGSDGDIYRFSADTEDPVTWESLHYLRTPDLVIRENGETLIEIAGTDA